MGRTSDARERLVESGRALMHEKGYTAVGVSEICTRAEVQKGSFYHFFPSKQELALAVIEGFEREGNARIRRALAGDARPLERLRAVFEAMYHDHREAKERCGKLLGCPIGNLALEMGSKDEVLRDRLGRVLEAQAGLIERVVAQAIELGDLPAQDPREAAASVLALIEGMLLLAKTRDDPEVLRGLPEKAFRMIGAETLVSRRSDV